MNVRIQSAPRAMRMPARDVPVVEMCDICVIGGSCTGVFAAVRAAQMGAKVVLLEKQNAFGGVAGSGLVNLWHKLESNDGSQQIIGGLTRLVLDRLRAVGAVGPSPYGFTLNTQELKIELDRLVVENGVIPLLHTCYCEPVVDGDRIQAVIIQNKSGCQAVAAKAYVDASGDGDLAKDIGIPFQIRDGLQPPTTCAAIEGLPASISKLLREHCQEFGLKPDNGWSADIPGTAARMYALTHVFETDASDAAQLTAAEIAGRRHIRAIMDVARKYGGEQNRPHLASLPSYIGIRETRTFQADYRLTEADVLTCRRFPDAIANGTYHVDIHNPETGEFMFKEPAGDFYQIPLSAMISSRAPNIVLAGRTISADRAAFGAIRVMVNLNQTGEAAGVAAALAAGEGVSTGTVKSGAVREQLARLGAVVI
ncbi:MAG: FAD-dependent oxidoreductase [Lentisphaeria bacterium]|nr:FAD-dependent oxidoreductase [Lentisphaeria bacterium]